jgi:diketogulonate reductase-like aldo/keto reductase
MKFEQLYDGKELPVIGLGTWNIGGGMTADYSRDDEAVDTISNAIKMGYSHIDTARMYGGGHTEELVGKAIRPFKREELFITTKVWSSNLRYRDVHSEFEASLKMLETDYVDLFLIHWPNPVIPLKETFRAFNEIVKSGCVRYVGVSNFSVKQLKRAQTLSDIPIATNQVEYNVLSRGPERTGLLEHCRKNRILLTAYQPLGKGRVLNHPALKSIAEKSEASIAQIALYWLTRKPMVITIPMTLNISHLRENLEAVDLEISDEILNSLDKLAPF